MSSYVVFVVLGMLSSLSVTAVVGRLEPIRHGGGGNYYSDVLYNTTATTVGGIISSLENASSSLGRGVMVVAIHRSGGGTNDSGGGGSGSGGRPNGSGGGGSGSGGGPDGNGGGVDDVPYGFLRTLQDRYEQPVYAVDLDRLLSDGRPRDTADGGDNELPEPCRRPVDRGLGSLLPLRSRYVVLFRGHVPPAWDPDPFVQLARLNYTFWDVDVYYLIVVVNGFDPGVRQMVYGLWRDLSIYKIIVVTPTAMKILDPFVRGAVNGRFLNVPPRSLRRIPGILHSRIGNLRRFQLRFVINNRTPTVIATRGGTGYVGQDGTFATVLAAKMNATPVYVSEPSANGKIHYGYRLAAGRAYGTFAGVIGGRADVSVNGHFLKDYNCYLAELTRHITSDKVCLLTPKAGVIPPMMTVLMSFQREVWMMTAVTCVLVTVIYFAAAALDTHRPGPTGCDLGLEIYRMFIGAPTNRVFAYSCRRILTSFCLVFTLVILNAFQGSLVTFLNTPMHYPDVNTFTDLKQSDLPIRTSSISFKEILTGDPNLQSLAYRVEKWEKEEDIHNSDGRFAGFERVNVFNLGHFKDVLFVANRNNTRVLHTMNECLISYFISYVVHRNSPYKRRINILLSWIDQAGLVLKWNGDVSKYIFNKYKPINPKDYDTSKVFSVRDLEIAFIVLSFGIILSITVFIIEMTTMMYKSLKLRTPHPPHLPFLH